jgi:hypothetical protein
VLHREKLAANGESDFDRKGVALLLGPAQVRSRAVRARFEAPYAPFILARCTDLACSSAPSPRTWAEGPRQLPARVVTTSGAVLFVVVGN